MIAVNVSLTPVWPDRLADVDVVQARFVLDFVSPCKLQPADFLGLGRNLRLAGRQMLDNQEGGFRSQWESLFQPGLSSDPVARRKFQKPAPAYVATMPIMQWTEYDSGDQLVYEVLFIGTGIPLIHVFLRSLIHLGRLGLAAGEGRFEVVEMATVAADRSLTQAWHQNMPLDKIACSVQPLTWLLQKDTVATPCCLEYQTPVRLMVAGKPLRKPRFAQVFPFLLRRVTSMLYTHCGIEMLDLPAALLDRVGDVDQLESKLTWRDWRTIAGRKGFVTGGFVGEMKLAGEGLEDIYWVIAVASLFGVGKGSSYGSGRIGLV